MQRIAVLFALAFLCACSAAAEQHGKPHWDYDPNGPAGPSRWGALLSGGERAYATCGTGRSQSPIDFRDVPVDAALGPLRLQWTPVTAFNMTNNGHTVQITPLAGGGGATDPVTGKAYSLLQVHFHSVSEHTFGSSARGLEAHFVHATSAGELMVVGVSFVASDESYNVELSRIWDGVATASAGGGRTVATLNITAIFPPSGAYFTYDGSLTTPPCTEGVRWVVLAEPLGISSAMLASMRAALGTAAMNWTDVSQFVPRGNYRPAQPLNGRRVRMYSPVTPAVPVTPSVSAGSDASDTATAASHTATAAACFSALSFLLALVVLSKLMRMEKAASATSNPPTELH